MSDEVKPAEKIAETLVAEAIADFGRAFMLMLGMGALHGQIDAVPHPGYWPTFFIVWGIQAVGSTLRGSRANA